MCNFSSVNVNNYIQIKEFCPKLFNSFKKNQMWLHFALLLIVYSSGDVFNQTEMISVFHSTQCSNYSCYLFYSLHWSFPLVAAFQPRTSGPTPCSMYYGEPSEALQNRVRFGCTMPAKRNVRGRELTQIINNSHFVMSIPMKSTPVWL